MDSRKTTQMITLSCCWSREGRQSACYFVSWNIIRKGKGFQREHHCHFQKDDWKKKKKTSTAKEVTWVLSVAPIPVGVDLDESMWCPSWPPKGPEETSPQTPSVKQPQIWTVNLVWEIPDQGRFPAERGHVYITHGISLLEDVVVLLFMGFSRQEYWNGWPFPSPVDHILSDLSTMSLPSWVAPHGMA